MFVRCNDDSDCCIYHRSACPFLAPATHPSIYTTMPSSDSEDEQERRRRRKAAKKQLKKEKKEQAKKEASSPSSCVDDLPKEADVDPKIDKAERKRLKNIRKEKKKEKKRQRTEASSSVEEEDVSISPGAKRSRASDAAHTSSHSQPRPMAESSALEYTPATTTDGDTGGGVTLLLFYQYVEPPWSDAAYQQALVQTQRLGEQAGVCGRMRVAKEGLNCTLTGTADALRVFCQSLRTWQPDVFLPTEFKLTHHLPQAQAFGNLKVMPVHELVNYGLQGSKAPPLHDYHGTHLEPADYHLKMAQTDTVMIDVRNHYEAQIGRFAPPTADWVDPGMRKSTEFPVWLDDPETQRKLAGKQVLMYCTGGIRCERASALLKYKMDQDPAVQALQIKGVYQLQGGIDKYFKEFPDGGYWKGKNYTFDKRYAHLPPALEGAVATKSSGSTGDDVKVHEPLSTCEACSAPWDKFRGKRRCPTCGVPSLICRACWQADQDGTKKLDKRVRCDLCCQQDVRSKRDLKAQQDEQLQEYEARMQAKGLLAPAGAASAETLPPPVANPDQATRICLRNLCRKTTTEEALCGAFPEVTHIVWRMDHKSQQFMGQVWVEMSSPDAAAQAVARSGETVLGRPVQISFAPPNGKDIWPPRNCAVR
jgi:predicted sulfurtransferase